MDLLKLLWGLILGHLYLGAVSAQVSVNGSLGGSVDFPVYITLPADRSITWRTGGGSIYIARILNNNAPSYNASYTSRTQLFPNGTLRLDKLTDADSRIYTVTGENQADFSTQTAEYQLRVFPRLNAPVLLSNVTINKPFINGTNVTLQCDAGNQTVTSYTFYRDGQKIICSDRVICRGSFLDFTPVADTDGGSYTCSIQNPVSTNTSNVLSLTVYFAVSNVAVKSNVSGLVWPGLDLVSLRCSANGTDVSYSWRLQGAPISGSQYTLTDNNATLIISPVSASDNGSFICLAKNLVNSLNSSDLRLNLAAPVSAVALTSNTSAVLWAGQDSVFLHCSAQGSAITFSWSLNGNQVSSKPPYYITQSDSPPNSNLTISPVSKADIEPFTCKATNRENNITSNGANLNINWFPDGDINCTAHPINEIVQLGCSWPGGKPAANVTMIFGDVQNTSLNEVYRNVSSSSNIHGSSLTCNGSQLGRTSSCVVTFVPPTSPGYKNNTSTPGVVDGAVNLTVDLQPASQSRATTVSAQALPATFLWFQGNSSSFIQNGGKFFVSSTPYTSTLKIDKLTEAESGDYKCVATNFMGSTTFLFNVKVSQSGGGGGSSSGLDGGAIAGIVIGVLAGVAIIGIIVFFILKKKKRSGDNGRLEPEDIGTIQYAEIHKDNKPNGGLAETVITNTPAVQKDELNYAALQFPNNPSTKAAAPVQKQETIYSDVKNSTKR